MLPAFINKNERFLRLCCNLARFFGLLLLAFVAYLLIGILLLAILKYNGSAQYLQGFVELLPELLPKLLPNVILRFLFPAFLLLGIEQLIKCLIVSDFKPNWILRFSDKIIYIYLGLFFADFVYRFTCTHTINNYSGHDAAFAIRFMLSGILTFIKILIWTGIGLLLKRIVPIIKESKTLV